jgi:hypothetical protein
MLAAPIRPAWTTRQRVSIAATQATVPGRRGTRLGSSLNRGSHGGAEFCGGCLPAQVGRSGTIPRHTPKRGHDQVGCLLLVKVLEH